jgi:hypothetical protein
MIYTNTIFSSLEYIHQKLTVNPTKHDHKIYIHERWIMYTSYTFPLSTYALHAYISAGEEL